LQFTPFIFSVGFHLRDAENPEVSAFDMAICFPLASSAARTNAASGQ
jgi:hypothetical protein